MGDIREYEALSVTPTFPSERSRPPTGIPFADPAGCAILRLDCGLTLENPAAGIPATAGDA
jgi:hypothetical protein